MKKLALILALVSFAASCRAQVEFKSNCARSYSCKEAIVTVTKLPPEELAEIAHADAEVRKAQAWAETVRQDTIRRHGGYVIPDTCFMGAGCFLATGDRVSDEVEWKGDYMILTKKWIPEL